MAITFDSTPGIAQEQCRQWFATYRKSFKAEHLSRMVIQSATKLVSMIADKNDKGVPQQLGLVEYELGRLQLLIYAMSHDLGFEPHKTVLMLLNEALQDGDPRGEIFQQSVELPPGKNGRIPIADRDI